MFSDTLYIMWMFFCKSLYGGNKDKEEKKKKKKKTLTYVCVKISASVPPGVVLRISLEAPVIG